MASQGWIALHRKIEESWLWNDEPFSRGQAWIDLLLLANHKEGKVCIDGNLITVERGGRITSLRYLADRWQWSTTKVKKFLDTLQSDKMLVYKSNTKMTSYTIVNYSDYQDINSIESNTEITQKKHKNKTEIKQKKNRNKQTTMINNDNNDNNDDDRLAKFISSFEKKTGIKILSSTTLPKDLDYNLLDKALGEIDNSTYLKNVNSVEWFLKNAEDIANKKYRDFKAKKAAVKFKGQTSKYSDEELNNIAKNMRYIRSQ